MAKIGIKGLTYAPYTSGGDGSEIVYGTGVQLADYMIRADVNEERSSTPFYADDHRIDSENEMTGISVSLELANFTDALDKAFLGHVDGTSSELNATDASAPFVGVGFYRKERFKGTVTYHAFWIYKAQFSKDGDSVQTKGESIDFQTEAISGSGMGVTLSSGGAVVYYSHSRQSTEAAAVSYLKGKAGIS
jgi:phi13 family phage major tail protein